MNPLRLIRHENGRPLGGDSIDVIPDDLPSGDPHDIAADATINALFHWSEACKLARELDDSEGADPTNKWGALAVERMLDAERLLILSILAWDDGFRDGDIHRAVKQHREPRGVVWKGVGYFAVPNPDREGTEEDEIDVMRLVVVPIANVVDLDRPAD